MMCKRVTLIKMVMIRGRLVISLFTYHHKVAMLLFFYCVDRSHVFLIIVIASQNGMDDADLMSYNGSWDQQVHILDLL